MIKDLKRYVSDRKKRDLEFASGYKSGYDEFKLEVMLKAEVESGKETEQQQDSHYQD